MRSATSGGHYALMYSWYFPKDSPSTELGHRHDWEGVIIWLSDSTSTSASNILAVCPSAHGEWNCSTDGYTLDGTSALIKYESVWPVNHSLGLTTTVGGTQPLVAWESMSSKLPRSVPDDSKPNLTWNVQRSCKMLWTQRTLDQGMCPSKRPILLPTWQRRHSELEGQE